MFLILQLFGFNDFDDLGLSSYFAKEDSNVYIKPFAEALSVFDYLSSPNLHSKFELQKVSRSATVGDFKRHRLSAMSRLKAFIDSSFSH